MKTDAEIFREALEKLLPAAVYGASVAGGIRRPGFRAMETAVREARRVLAIGRPRAAP